MIEDEGGKAAGVPGRRDAGRRLRGDGARGGGRVRDRRHPRQQHRPRVGAARSSTSPKRQWDRALDINLRTAFLASKYAVPVMAAKGAGSIVNVSSISALRGDGTAAYSAAKGGLAR